jgi:bzd-type benzoyl-CoA reductase Q subunit
MADKKPLSYASIRTGSNSKDSAVNAMNRVLELTGLQREEIAFTVGTGYGRVNAPFADKTVTEITCHARGANFIYGPSVRTILDMGGQDCKAIHCDENGRVRSFMMNDKCAAGTGRGMEVIADLLGVPIEEIGARSFEADQIPKPITSQCVVFAKTEVGHLMREGWTKEQVLAAYCQAMADRVARLLERNGMELDFAITGGIAKNIGVVRRVEKLMGVTALQGSYDSQIAGALGGALMAYDLLEKRKRRGQRS